MPIELKMPALSPTMEEGTLAKWLVKEGDVVKSGDILAEIETDKATMEFEAVDEGTIAQIIVPEGSDGVKVGAPIALLLEEGEDASAALAKPAAKPAKPAAPDPTEPAPAKPEPGKTETKALPPEEKGYGASPRDDAPIVAADERKVAPQATASASGDRVKASPLARRLAEQQGIDLASVAGSGPDGRIVKADLDSAKPGTGTPAAPAASAAPASAALAIASPAVASPAKPTPVAEVPAAPIPDIPHDVVKLSSMRKVIARRLAESKQQVPHIYLTVDIRLDPLLALREQLNKSLAAREIKLSVNDMLIKALAVALMEVPACNVMLAGNQLVTFARADISVAVSIPGGLITPVVTGADGKALSAIATEFKDLASRARDGKLKPEEFQGGTASISNMGMYGIKQFDAVINPPQGMIMAVGAGEKRPWVEGDELVVATVMSATGSFDHRAIDGADGAKLMKAFKRLVENPLGMVA